MTVAAQARRPAAFRLDDPDVRIDEHHSGPEPTQQAGRVVIRQEPEQPFDAAPAPVLPAPRRRRFPWATIFWSAFGALVSLAMGLAVTKLVDDLFARIPSLGWVGLLLAVVASVALIAIAGREVLGFARLAAVHRLQAAALKATMADDAATARTVVADLLSLLRNDPSAARARRELERHFEEIIDGADLILLAERALMSGPDAKARALISAAATRVSLVTAVSPRAAVDMLFVLINAVRLIRSLSELYGGRPGTLGLLRLVRQVIAHLALTGGMAAGDSLVQQVLGHGLAAKLSARLGEGVLNGLLTARLGVAALDVVRPLPFAALPRPTLSELAAGLMRRRDASSAP